MSNISSEMSDKPIIRWAGSKRKLLPQLVELVPANFNRYIEPFCGSACLFFKLSPDDAILGDINAELINAFRQIRTHTDMHDELSKIPQTPNEYYRLRALDPEHLSAKGRATRFLYLNRFCFNGVYRTNIKGQFNVPRGSRTGEFPSKDVFKSVRLKLKRAQLNVASYEQTLAASSRGDFTYIDPPYAKSGKFTGEYGLGSFNSELLSILLEDLHKLDSRGVKFLVSYRACEEVIELLSNRYSVTTINVKRHISGFKSGWSDASEILLKNY